jgi:MATE family multidrug resistance protein
MTTAAAVRRELRPTLALAVPIVVGQLSQMLIALTDTAFIGQLGATPLAVAAFTQGISGMFYVVGVGSIVGPGVFAAREQGAGDRASAASWHRHGLLFALLVGAVAFALMVVLSTQLGRLGQPLEVVALAGPFYFLIAASLVPALIFQAQRQFAEAVGHAWGPMAIIVSNVALNALLNWLLVFGHWGFPELGLVGSAWSTLIARTVAALAVAAWLRWGKAFVPFRAAARLPWQRSRLAALLRFGVPTGGMLLFEVGAFSAAALMMGWLGTVPLAAHQIALGCASLTFMVPLGLSHAVSLRISQARGAGRTDAVQAIGVGALLAGLAVMLAFAVLFAWQGHWVSERFTPVGSVATLATELLVVAAIFQVFDGTQVISVGALRGLGDVRLPTLLTFGAYWLLSLPLGYWLAFHAGLGPRGLWLGLAAGLAAAAVSLALRFLHKAKSVLVQPA